MDERFEQVDKRFEQVNNRFGDMFNYFYILTGIFTTIMVANIGFAFWDRRTVIRQAQQEATEFIEREGYRADCSKPSARRLRRMKP